MDIVERLRWLVADEKYISSLENENALNEYVNMSDEDIVADYNNWRDAGN